ncbi:inositol 1,4,5-triphosphate receptor associated 2 isoform X2 [Kryptolebias marmoratus]|uniref:inositol 1,4,5-triphosphate receptor associated 2 isoform X2 n=1 Tax=Kryptolebias marmoratus TaxID=37003 RepID=UPI0007F8693B|nr:inositol 1,4,5-triphosphate receptor associated 2 isoform X2 [Kryptolebias marmoratus]
MDSCTPQPSRRHNPVDSICRKLKTIQWRGDREPNLPFQIPKLSSSSYDSPRCGFRRNLEAVLRRGAISRDEGERGMGVPSSGPSVANATYSITSTLGERRGADGGDSSRVRPWQRHCSTPTAQTMNSPYFALAGGPRSEQPDRTGRSPPLSRTFTPTNSTFSCNVNFCSADSANSSEFELPYPALVVKRLSMGDGGPPVASENRRSMAEVSLICEENLLDTIFHVCDTQRRGKVYVSHIVDYLRHTTSRSSEDTGLEELCNMLDPEHKDVSIDLDTYHAVMREWIDDCRNNSQETADDSLQEGSVKLRDTGSARRSMLLNMTSGSLEAFGGEVSRAELETSELVYCLADVQMSNQRLQEEVKGLKQVMESMEESNQKLAEENEQLRNQARVNQQLAQKEEMLKEEVEEMKATLTCTEEGRARASAHSKHMERENQSLITKIASLQEENFKITMEADELQKKIKELCDINTDLQVQIHSFDAVISEKQSVILEKSEQIDELKAAVEEYSAITELLRKDKNKLENQMQMILPDLARSSLSLAYRLNQSSVGSLHAELALAQSPLEAAHGVDHLLNVASPLDETLDRDVLLMLQGPNSEHVALDFESLLNKLKRDLTEEAGSVLNSVKDLLDAQPDDNADARLQRVQAELDSRRADWVGSLDQLAQYTDSLEKELIKMASNMRRSRTEILHLSVRLQEKENPKRQLCEELEQLKTSQDSREASCQTAAEEEPGVELDWEEEFSLQDFLKHEEAERNCWAQDEQRDCRPEAKSDKLTGKGEEEDGEERWTVVDTTGGDDARKASTPLSAVSVEGGRDSAPSTEPDPEPDSAASQEEAAVPASAHSQAVSVKHPEADALPDLSHSENNSEALCETAEFRPGSSAQTPGSPPEQELTGTPAADMDPPTADETTSQSESAPPTSKDLREVEADPSAADMSRHKILSREQSMDKPAVEDSTSLLPVLVEEEESVQDCAADAPTVAAGVPGTDQITCSGPNNLSEKSSPRSGSSVVRGSQSGGGMSNATSDPSIPELGKNKKDSLLDKNKKELTRSMEPTEKVPDEPSETSVASRRASDTSVISDNEDVFKEDKNGLSPTDKEIEAEFQRLALGFKCDMFTLEKRLRLEERSRDLAEENVRREVSSCQGLLQALIPLCEDDSQSMEIIQRLQKNLEILIQSMTRVSSRSEMLGAIHQENRIGKAVEVMIQHVENLRRTYTKEHAELLELREALMQSERSFGSQTEKDDFRGKKPLQNKSTRRFSIAPIPCAGGGNMQFDMAKFQDGSEADAERLTRRSPWNMAGKSMTRPPLKRFVSSAAWVDTEEPSVMMKGPSCTSSDCQSEDEQKDEKLAERRRSSLSELGSKLTSLILPLKTPSSSSTPTSTDPGMSPSLSHSLTGSRSAAAAVARGSRGLWMWLAIIVVLAGLLALLASLVMQPAVDAAPVGTGDSWMTIQQLLWPYTELRHNGQPPV